MWNFLKKLFGFTDIFQWNGRSFQKMFIFLLPIYWKWKNPPPQISKKLQLQTTGSLLLTDGKIWPLRQISFYADVKLCNRWTIQEIKLRKNHTKIWIYHTIGMQCTRESLVTSMYSTSIYLFWIVRQLCSFYFRDRAFWMNQWNQSGHHSKTCLFLSIPPQWRGIDKKRQVLEWCLDWFHWIIQKARSQI